MEDDLTKSCSVYPTLQYTSYDQCDMEYVREKTAAVFGSDFIPIWATTDINKVTKNASLPDELCIGNGISHLTIMDLEHFPLPASCPALLLRTNHTVVSSCIWPHGPIIYPGYIRRHNAGDQD